MYETFSRSVIQAFNFDLSPENKNTEDALSAPLKEESNFPMAEAKVSVASKNLDEGTGEGGGVDPLLAILVPNQLKQSILIRILQ